MTRSPSSSIRSVCVYCGSSPGRDPQFLQAATELGETLARHNIRLVYGGGDKGLMGRIAESVLAHGGEVQVSVKPDEDGKDALYFMLTPAPPKVVRRKAKPAAKKPRSTRSAKGE